MVVRNGIDTVAISKVVIVRMRMVPTNDSEARPVAWRRYRNAAVCICGVNSEISEICVAIIVLIYVSDKFMIVRRVTSICARNRF